MLTFVLNPIIETMKILSYILFSIIFFASWSCKRDGSNIVDNCNNCRTLEIHLQGQKYDRLILEATKYVPNIHDSRIYPIEGKQVEDYHWAFQIPDSIIKSLRYFSLKHKPFDFKTNTDFKISFMSVIKGDTAYSEIFTFDKNMNPIEGSFYDRSETDWFRYSVGDSIYIDEVTVLYDRFFINLENYKNTELEAIMKTEGMGMYKEAYQEQLKDKIAKAEKYSYSKYLLAELTYFRNSYDNRDDFRKVYEKFKNTEDEDTKFYKKIIDYYLKFDPQDFLFENIKLENSVTGAKELIIEDPEKYSLVVFSASWCGPCHKRIPMLKEIFSEKGNKINIIYISIDSEKTIQSWKNLLQKEGIPWRSLSLPNDENDMMKKYSVPGVPYMMLIHPDRKGEIIDDLMTKDDKEKMYEKLN